MMDQAPALSVQQQNARPLKKAEISVAPMMDWTDRHCRYFHRLLAPHIKLYTEMITTGALLHGDAERFLRFDAQEHPVALQLGGSDPTALAQAARMGEEAGYDEINLNCGCPSDRVQNGQFGACLMGAPDLVAACYDSMQEAVDIPVTIKCRIGIDDQDDFAFLDKFVGRIADKGCKTFIIHARKAWLSGLSPKENRTIPPIQYERVRDIKGAYPALNIIVNGEITDLTRLDEAMSTLDGAMIGREAYKNPWFLTEVERHVWGHETSKSREDIALEMIPYAQAQYERFGTPIKSITRHMLGLYHNQPNGKRWRQILSTLPYEDGADVRVIEAALKAMTNP